MKLLKLSSNLGSQIQYRECSWFGRVPMQRHILLGYRLHLFTSLKGQKMALPEFRPCSTLGRHKTGQYCAIDDHSQPAGRPLVRVGERPVEEVWTRKRAWEDSFVGIIGMALVDINLVELDHISSSEIRFCGEISRESHLFPLILPRWFILTI